MLLQVKDGVILVDRRFDPGPRGSRGEVLMHRYTPDPGTLDQRLDFAYLETESLTGFAGKEALHAFEEALATRRVLADVLLE
jgi:hypothetical protein